MSALKVLNKRDGGVEECTKRERSAAEKELNERAKGSVEWEGVIRKALDEALYFMHMFVIIVLFLIYHVCIFLPTKERVNREKAK